MAKEGFCHCDAVLPLSGNCAYGCSPFADPVHLRLQARKRAEQEAYRSREDNWTITQEDRRRMNRAIARFDPFMRAARKRGRKAGLKSHAIGARR